MSDMDSIESEDPGYEVKTVQILDKADAYTVMMVKFGVDKSGILSNKGFRGDYVVFTVMRAGNLYSTYDPYQLGLEFNLDLLESFAVGIRAGVQGYDEGRIDWEDVDEGEIIDWDRYEELIQW